MHELTWLHELLECERELRVLRVLRACSNVCECGRNYFRVRSCVKESEPEAIHKSQLKKLSFE